MLGETLKQLRKEKKMSQQQVADIIHVSQQTYAKYENGTIEPNIENISALSNYFSVSIDYLLNKTTQESDATQKFYNILDNCLLKIENFNKLNDNEIKKISDILIKIASSPGFEFNDFYSNLMLEQCAEACGVTTNFAKKEWGLRKFNEEEMQQERVAIKKKIEENEKKIEELEKKIEDIKSNSTNRRKEMQNFISKYCELLKIEEPYTKNTENLVSENDRNYEPKIAEFLNEIRLKAYEHLNELPINDKKNYTIQLLDIENGFEAFLKKYNFDRGVFL